MHRSTPHAALTGRGPTASRSAGCQPGLPTCQGGACRDQLGNLQVWFHEGRWAAEGDFLEKLPLISHYHSKAVRVLSMNPHEDSHAELLAAVTLARQQFMATGRNPEDFAPDDVNLPARTTSSGHAAFSRYSWAVAAGAVASVGILITVELWGSLREPTGPANNNEATVTVAMPAIPGSSDSILDQARAFTAHKQYSKAEAIYRTVAQSDPTDTEVNRLLVDVLFRQKKFAECAELINSIAAPDSPVVPARPPISAPSRPRMKHPEVTHPPLTQKKLRHAHKKKAKSSRREPVATH